MYSNPVQITEKELDYGLSCDRFIPFFEKKRLCFSEIVNNYLLSYENKPTRGEIATCHSRKTDNIETSEASAFGVCTIRLSDILITKLLWTIQTAAKQSEGSQMEKK